MESRVGTAVTGDDRFGGDQGVEGQGWEAISTSVSFLSLPLHFPNSFSTFMLPGRNVLYACSLCHHIQETI